MADMNPFARLDTSLMRSTKPQEKEPTESQQYSNTASQQNGSTAVHLASKPAIQQASKPTEKVTYRFHPQGVKAIKEIKWLLFNTYGIEADLAEIAEQAIFIAHQDLLASQQASKIVLQLASKP
jgi:hypothetical protein